MNQMRDVNGHDHLTMLVGERTDFVITFSVPVL